MGHGTQEKRGKGRTKKGEQTGKKSGGRKRDREREFVSQVAYINSKHSTQKLLPQWLTNQFWPPITTYVVIITIRYDTRCYFNVRLKAEISKNC